MIHYDIEQYKEAKQIFYAFGGSKFHMEREGILDKYRTFMVPKDLEYRWTYEIIEHTEEMLLKESNTVLICEYFFKCRNYAGRMRDEDIFEFLMNYIKENICKLDTYTSMINLNCFCDGVRNITDRRKRKKYYFKSYILTIMLLKQPVTISSDYKDDLELTEVSVRRRLRALKGFCLNGVLTGQWEA